MEENMRVRYGRVERWKGGEEKEEVLSLIFNHYCGQA
jgi:hypothetical protein